MLPLATKDIPIEHCVPVPPMLIPLAEQDPSVDGSQTPFEHVALLAPLTVPLVQDKVADAPLGKGPIELPVE